MTWFSKGVLSAGSTDEADNVAAGFGPQRRKGVDVNTSGDTGDPVLVWFLYLRGCARGRGGGTFRGRA